MSQTNISVESASAVINRQIHIDREVAHCHNIDEIVSSLSERYEMCTLLNTKVSLVFAHLSNFDELGLSLEAVDDFMSILARSMLKLTRSADVVIKYGQNHLIVLLVACDQFNAAKVCQRFKDAIHRTGFLSHKFAKDFEFDFGIAEDVPNYNHTIDKLVEEAYGALNIANSCGSGAVIRRADMEGGRSSLPREHFVEGEPHNGR